MLIYSIIPEEIIFSQVLNVEDELQEITMADGVILEIRNSHREDYEIVRVISTNPAHYIGL
ncbi:MAG: ribonuclease [Clostridiales bacterium]|nr:ribonuclease [Clostridiales bacterium]